MKLEKITIELITYGLGNKIDLNKINTIKNNKFVKPKGGLWASPINAEFGWREWCNTENFGNLETSFIFKFSGDTLKIDSERDLYNFPWEWNEIYENPNFEKIEKSGCDAIWLTENGMRSTHLSMPRNLYGWDCECVLILNKKGIVLEMDSICSR